MAGSGQFQMVLGTISDVMPAFKPTGSSGSQVSLVNTLPFCVSAICFLLAVLCKLTLSMQPFSLLS